MILFDIKFPLYYGEHGTCTIGDKEYDIEVDGDLGWFYIRGCENHLNFCRALHEKFPDLFPKEKSDLLETFKCVNASATYFPEFPNLNQMGKFLKFVNNYSEI